MPATLSDRGLKSNEDFMDDSSGENSDLDD